MLMGWPEHCCWGEELQADPSGPCLWEAVFYAVALDSKATLGVATSNLPTTYTNTTNIVEEGRPYLNGWECILFAHLYKPWLPGWQD